MDFDAVLRDYKSLRVKSVELNTVLAQSLSKEDISRVAKMLGMLKGRQIQLETEDEIGVLMDFAIHQIRHDGQNAVDRQMIKSRAPEGTAEYRLLRSMQKCEHGLLDVIEPVPGYGVHAAWGSAAHRIFVADVGFSITAKPYTVMLTHIHSPAEGWYITTGAVLPVDDEAAQDLANAIKNYADIHGTRARGLELAAMLARTCIAAGASKHVRYATPGHPEAVSVLPPTIRHSRRVGRNDPCPCGSGKKYKKCCLK